MTIKAAVIIRRDVSTDLWPTQPFQAGRNFIMRDRNLFTEVERQWLRGDMVLDVYFCDDLKHLYKLAAEAERKQLGHLDYCDYRIETGDPTTALFIYPSYDRVIDRFTEGLEKW